MINTELFEHQKQALAAVRENIYGDTRGYALFMDTGTGKTLTAIAYAEELLKAKDISKVVIISPKSLCHQWRNEIIKRTDNDPKKVRITDGDWISRLNAFKDGLYCCINFEGIKVKGVLYNFVDYLSKKNMLVVIDESSFIKHGTTKRSKAIHFLGDALDIKESYKLILSGAPITTGAQNIWSQYRFSNPNIFGKNYWKFVYKNLRVEQEILKNRSFRKIIGVANPDEFRKKISSGSFIIKKEDCLDLPPKILMPTRVFELSKEHYAAYKQLAVRSIIELKDETLTFNHKLQVLAKLRQVANGFVYNNGETHFYSNNKRLDEFIELLEECDYKKRKIFVVHAFTADGDNVEKACKKIGANYARTHRGKVQEAVDKFRRDDCNVLIGQIQLTSHGLDLYFADTMIHYSQYFSSDFRRQVHDRIHRIGQTKKTVYFDLAAKGTIDLGILQIHERNIALANLLVRSSYEGPTVEGLVYGDN